MRSFIIILLCMCIVYGSTYANTSIKVDTLSLVARCSYPHDARVQEKHDVGARRVSIDILVDYLHKNETGVYKLYSERALRLQLGKAMEEELHGKVFRRNSGMMVGVLASIFWAQSQISIKLLMRFLVNCNIS